jgi:TonB family protein
MKSRFPRLARVLSGLLFLAWLPAAPHSAAAAEDFVPCKIHQRVKVKFPLRALNEGITRGEVWLFLEVDRDGRLGDVLAFAHSGRDFAQAALEAVEQWQYAPALVAGEPVRSINRMHVQFEVNGVTAYTKLIGAPEERAVPGERYEYRPFTLGELDRVPKALSRPSPVYPREWIRQGRTGAVIVDYFIDEDGHTRFPRVVGEPDELLGAATVEAVKTWQFEPPMRQGQRVLAQVRQEFHFRPEKTTAERG